MGIIKLIGSFVTEVFLLIAGTAIVVVTALFCISAYRAYFPPVDIRVAGQVVPSLVVDHEFQLAVWHQHAGPIRNGKLTVVVAGDHLKNRLGNRIDLDEWSFEEWKPNFSESRNFRYYLNKVGPDVTVLVDVYLTASGTPNLFRRYQWANDEWMQIDTSARSNNSSHSR